MKLWEKGNKTDRNIENFTVGKDRELDLHLAKYDVLASIAHAEMLKEVGLISKAEGAQLVTELTKIGRSIAVGEFHIGDEFEDMHSKIEYELIQQLGDTGKKIHTARSRNDQVLVALQLFLKEEISNIESLTVKLIEDLLQLASKHRGDLLPGYTHLQQAMPSSFGLWFSAYAELLIDDVYFLRAARRIVDQNPLGSAAGYGSSFPIDRAHTTQSLGFSTMKYSAVAAQLGRGKIERATTSALAAVAATLSKMATDICLYMNQNFSFISFPDSLTTGSSIMPHKKNPDIFELVRANCNRIQSLPNEISLVTINLPSGYHRDFQLLKETLLPGVFKLKEVLEIFSHSIVQIEVRKNILEAKQYDSLFTVDSVHHLVNRGIPFRDAYRKVADEIEQGSFKADRDLKHTHHGSIGNLCLDEIRSKLKNL